MMLTRNEKRIMAESEEFGAKRIVRFKKTLEENGLIMSLQAAESLLNITEDFLEDEE